MVYRIELLCTMMRFLADLLHAFKKYLSMALCSNSSSHASSHQPPPWKKLPEPPAATAVAVAVTVAAGGSNGHTTDQNNSHSVEELVGSRLAPKERSNENTATAGSNGHTTNHNNWHSAEELVATRLAPKEHLNEKNVQEAPQQSASSTTTLAAPPPTKAPENKPQKERMRPSMITIPVPAFSNGRFGFPDHVEMERNGADQKDYVTVLEADGYCLASRRGRRRHTAMEDGHDIISCIDGDSKQAYFGVFDGHGGRAAVDFVSGKLGKNILAALHELEKEESQSQSQPEMAIRKGYLTTDREFLSQGVRSGVCAATVLLKDGNLHVANVGDCRVVMSRTGVAYALTDDHRPGREDEQNRIVNSGGFVSCHNGMWRVQDSLAVSRAFGNESMKEWVICEPETKKIHLTPDCEFLVMASDGLWDKVSNQEAVDVVVKHKTSIDSCKELVEISCNRGNRDDITVMVIKLETFVQLELENVQKLR